MRLDSRKTRETTASARGDDELLELTMSGDEEAFTTLYRRRQGGIYRFAFHMSASAQVAEDVTQEVFIVLMRDGVRYDPRRGPLSAYLYGIARNLILRRIGRDRAYVPIPEDGQSNESPLRDELVCREDPLSALARSEVIQSVRGAVLALPPHYREVIVLCEFQEMSYEEAAIALGCAVGTVRSRLHRARRVLAEKLRAVVEAGRAPKQGERCLI